MAKGNSGHQRMTAGYPTGSSSRSEEQPGLKESAQEMASQASETAGHLKEKAQEFVSGVAGQAQDTWRGAREGMQEGWSQVSDRAGDIWEDATGFIRRYPVASLAVAFGLGCLLGCGLAAMPRGTDDIADRMSRASS
jgi:ElaB/YqjD/DUF883 family membrane-anchored ribosome-binding protein